MSSSQWIYDAARKDYYYYDPTRQLYVYQSGRTIRVPGQSAASQASWVPPLSLLSDVAFQPFGSYVN
jgi:hypothetical protein